jgi:hypothetical protein
MKDQDINITIAESRGLEIENFTPWNGPTHKAYRDSSGYHKMPSYTTDLNAIHKVIMEEIVNHSAHRVIQFKGILVQIVGHIDLWCAESSELAEAYLKTIGKYES